MNDDELKKIVVEVIKENLSNKFKDNYDELNEFINVILEMYDIISNKDIDDILKYLENNVDMLEECI